MIKINFSLPNFSGVKKGASPEFEVFEMELASALKKEEKHDDKTPIRLLAAGLHTLKKKKEKDKKDPKEPKESKSGKSGIQKEKGVKEKSKKSSPNKTIEKKENNHPSQDQHEKKFKKTNKSVARFEKMPHAKRLADALDVNLDQLRLEHLPHPPTKQASHHTMLASSSAVDLFTETDAIEEDALEVLKLTDLLDDTASTEY